MKVLVSAAAAAAAAMAAASLLAVQPASAKTLPQGKSVWMRMWSGPEVKIKVVRRGDRIKIVSPGVVHRGAIQGDVLRLRPNEVLGDVTYSRFRVKRDVLRIRWEGQSKWTRFQRIEKRRASVVRVSPAMQS